MSRDPHTADEARRPRAAVIYHPLKTQVEQLADAVDEQEKLAGFGPTLWYETAEDDAGKAAARKALDNKAAVLLVSGGDGTVRAVAEVLSGTGVPMAIIPQGTGNLMARNLGIPLTDWREQVQAAFAGDNLSIDLGVATITRGDGSASEHSFLVLAGMGLDARAISTTSSKLKKSVGWLAYVDAGLRSLVNDEPLRVQLSLDDGPTKSLRVFTLMVGNCGLLPGGVLLIPDAKMHDGLLDLVALRPPRRLGPLSFVRILNKIWWENGVLRRSRVGRQLIDLSRDVKSVMYRQVHTVDLRVAEPEPIQLDGDDFGTAIRVQSRVDPAALVVRTLPHWVPGVPDGAG